MPASSVIKLRARLLHSGLLGLVVSVLCGWAIADPPAALPPIDPTAVRTAVPTGIALDRAERRFADAYEIELADKSDTGRRKLIQSILTDAPQTRDDPAARYVMLREARKLALALNDASTADYLGHQIELLYTLMAGGSSNQTADAVPAAGAIKPRARLPLPSEAAYGESRKKLRSKYASYYANTSSLVRSSLLGKLLLDMDGASEAADQYAALREAADVAIALGDLKTAMQCDATLASIYRVDETDLRVAALTAAASHMGKAIPAHDLAVADIALAEDALRADNYDAAMRALTLATPALAAAGDEALTVSHRKREKEIREIRDEFQRASASIKKLNGAPSDVDANLRAGRFYCLVAGNWTKGLPMLVKGSDIALKLLAELEMAGATTLDAQLKLADGWWDKSAGESGAASTRCKQRAGYWYRRAKSASPTVPDRVTTRLLATSRSIDLLALMGRRDRVSGQWTGTATRLTCTDAGVSRLQFPHNVPEEYDFAVQFIIKKPGDNVVQIVPMRDGWFAWGMSIDHCALQALDSNARPTYNHITIVANKPYLSILEVRKTGVRATINGVLAGEWKTNYTDFTSPPAWKLGDPKMLGFGSSFTEVTLTSAKLIDLGGDAQ